MTTGAPTESKGGQGGVAAPPKMIIKVCAGTGCVATGALEVAKKFRAEIDRLHGEVEAEVEETSCLGSCDVGITGCHGFCAAGPLVKIAPMGVMYCYVRSKDVPEIVETTVRDGNVVDRLLYKDPVEGSQYKGEEDIPFFSKQVRHALHGCGEIDPENIDEYESAGGYTALKKVVAGMAREDVIEQIKRSGLQGRGGGGFPTGLKWQFVHEAPGDVKYVVCNGDEGDPGAFMDRSVMEGDPHAVIEGMTIAGYTVGANRGVIYVRAEYPLAVNRLKIALAEATERGYIGDRVAGSDFAFQLSIVEGAGAFVCGEETALLHSIEGRRGMPRPRPPYPAIRGLWSKPTLINNVETYANVPVILRSGAENFSNVGTKLSKGTKTFALTGQVNNIGLVEVPMGITLREIIFDIGGGLPEQRKFKAAQTGGPSGGCIPASHLDTPIDYKTLTDLGSMMGSGGLVVMDEGTCMVKLAKFFLEFCVEESCGKCPPCRLGTKVMLNTLERLCEGNGKPGDIEELEQLGAHIKQSSLCGLGQTAPNPTLSTIHFFRHEYEEHIHQKHCPAGECYKLVEFFIEESICNGCHLCARNCPVEAIVGEKKQVHHVDTSTCINCGSCLGVCPTGAVKVR
jgi:NADH:ubiquinone oxidoreductase subunit F (NADH-binding)/(2Fe-2S) ferredoxin